MSVDSCGAELPAHVLTAIIKTQTEVAKMGLDLGGVMDLAARRILELTQAQGAIVEMAEGDEMVYRAASGMAAPQLGLRLKMGNSLSGLCVREGSVLQCDDCENDPRVDREACRRVGLRSMVVAPLLHGETVVGVLKIVSAEPGFFTPQHVCLLGMMSELIAAAMFFSAKYEIQELYHKATHDMLTGLANRALFYDRLRQGLALAGRRSSFLCVLNLDMDGLKAINDVHGHRAGDAAIKELAGRTSRAARESDTVARLGGDEFGVILTDVRDRESAEETAERIATEIRQPFRFEDVPLALDASIGLAMFPEDASGVEDLIEKADKAMYNVKRGRKGHRE